MASVFESIRGALRRSVGLSIVALVAICSLPSFPALAAEQKAAEVPKPAAPPPPVAIPLADIATEATKVANLLSSINASTTPSAQIENIRKTLPELSERLDAQFAATTKSLQAQPTLETLQTEQQQWQSSQVQATGLLNVLTQHATKLQDSLNQLTELQKTWSTTRASAQTAKAPDPILQQIDATLDAIAAARAPLDAQRADVLDLQSHVAKEVTKCGTALQRIADFQQKAVAGIFVPDAPPIWKTESWQDALPVLPEHVRKVSLAYWSDIIKYLHEPRDGGPLHAALFIALALLFRAARRKIDVWDKSGADTTSAIIVFERPYAAALVVTLLVATSPFFQMSTSVRQLLIVVALIPMIRLVRPTVNPLVASGIYALALLFALGTIRQTFTVVQVISQTMLVVESFMGIAVLLWLRHRRKSTGEMAESSSLIALRLGGYLLFSVLVIALAAGAVGYTRLARLLTPGIIVGGILALAVFAYLRVVGGIVALAFRVWPLRLLRMVQQHRDRIERRVYHFLAWMAVIGWLVRYLNYLGLMDPTWSLVEGLLAAKLERGTISISVGSILEFFLTVWLAYVLSAFIRFALQEDVYPRINIAPGLSYAASSLLNYVILALGFIAGLGVLGVDFSKVGILAGAFGVGIGFGLQSVVNNFVSGLILLFERPIHVGDAIQVGNLQGRVRRIGIRASVVRTLQGAEIIVPNANLITQEVTNWTLSDQLRRLDLPVGVNYGAAPKKVIELLEAVAREHPKVLQEPAPRCLFLSYGDSSISFELRAWTEYSNSQQVHSDLTVAIYDAVYAAGMSFPFPQREVRLIQDPSAQPAAGPVP